MILTVYFTIIDIKIYLKHYRRKSVGASVYSEESNRDTEYGERRDTAGQSVVEVIRKAKERERWRAPWRVPGRGATTGRLNDPPRDGDLVLPPEKAEQLPTIRRRGECQRGSRGVKRYHPRFVRQATAATSLCLNPATSTAAKTPRNQTRSEYIYFTAITLISYFQSFTSTKRIHRLSLLLANGNHTNINIITTRTESQIQQGNQLNLIDTPKKPLSIHSDSHIQSEKPIFTHTGSTWTHTNTRTSTHMRKYCDFIIRLWPNSSFVRLIDKLSVFALHFARGLGKHWIS